MSDSVQLVIDGYERYNSGQRIPDLQFWREDAEYHASSEDPDSSVHRGIAAIQRHFGTWEEAYPDLRVEPVEVAGNGDTVFAWVRFVGHGASSGVPIDMQIAHVHTIRDGRVARLVEFSDRDEALAAAGIAE
jgi:uncharacterized protein